MKISKILIPVGFFLAGFSLASLIAYITNKKSKKISGSIIESKDGSLCLGFYEKPEEIVKKKTVIFEVDKEK